MTVEMIFYAVGAAILIAAFLDAKMAKIPNWIIFVLLALFVAQAVMFPTAVDLYWQIGVAAAVFVAGLILFALGAIGAGAVKFGAAIMLFMPLEQWGWLLGIFVAGLFFYTFLFILLQGMFGGEESTRAALRKRIVPMSWPIGTMALAGLFYL